MISAFKPRRTAFYSLLALFTVLFFRGNLASVFPAVLLVMAVNGWESYYRADLDRIFGKADYGPEDKGALLRLSCLLATLAVAAAFYFNLAMWYVPITFLAFFAAWLSHQVQFASDFLLSFSFTGMLLAHSTDALAMAPLYWFVFFRELGLRSIFQLSRPFGMEAFNLTQILGPDAASNFVAAMLCISSFWPVLMARYATGFAFVFFSLSGMVLAASIYAVVANHLDRSRELLRGSSYIFVVALYLHLAGLRF